MKELILLLLFHVSQHASGVEVFDDEESVQLPCLVKVSALIESTVVWSREDLLYSTVHVRQPSGDDHVGQNERYRTRTSMRTDALQTGDLSLTLRNPKISDSETYTCTVRRAGEELSRSNVELKVTGRPPVWPKVLAGVLVPLVLLVLLVLLAVFIFYRKCRRTHTPHTPGSQVEVDSGVESVQLTCRTTFKLPKNAKVEWRDSRDRKVHVRQKDSDQPEEQHWWYKGRTQMKTGDLSLTLKHPTDRDSHIYTCSIYNNEGTFLMKEEVEFRVKVPQVNVEEGVESVHLPCRFRGQLPPDVTVEWTYMDIWITKVHVFQNGSDQQEEQYQRFRGRTEMKEDLLDSGDLSLTLKHPTDRDNNTFTCSVYDTERNILMRKQVKIQVKVCRVEVEEGVEPVLLPFITTPDLPEDAEVLWWRVEPEPPKTILKHQKGCNHGDQQDQFYRGRTEIHEDHLRTGDLSLKLKYPTDRDTGRYICSISSRNIFRKKTVLLKVINRQVEVEEGVESIQLPFRTSPDLPRDTRVEWTLYEPQHMKVHVYQNGSDHPEDQNQDYRDRTEMKEDLLDSGDLTLTLKQPRVPDSGTYRCKVSSKEGNWSRETSVLVRVRERRQHQDPPEDNVGEDIPLMEVH